VSHDVETLLRDSLRAEADAAVPWGAPAVDPWPRVERAHRRGVARRRAGLAALLVGVLAAAGVAGTRLDDLTPPPPAGHERDTWEDLDDGRTRGEPVDGATRAGVAAALRACCSDGVGAGFTYRGDPAGLRFLWAGTLGGHPTVLVRATLDAADGDPAHRIDALAWARRTAGTPYAAFGVRVGGPAAVSLPYVDDGGTLRALVVVRRGASLESARAVIRADGGVTRDWTPERVDDGVARVALADTRTYAPTELRVRYPGSAVAYVTAVDPDLRRPGPTEAELDRALADARGDASPAGVRADARASLGRLLALLRSDAGHARPAVFWAGSAGAGRSAVVLTGGYPGQGRVVLARGVVAGGDVEWEWAGTVPSGPVTVPAGPIVWRAPVPYLKPAADAHVVGWLLPAGASRVTVTVAGEPVAVPQRDGLGLVEVRPGHTVEVRATLAGGTPYGRVVLPEEAAKPRDPQRTDLFPPGGPD
jgi:hypothetical protein